MAADRQKARSAARTDREALLDVAKSARRLLRHEHSPESDEMGAALTDLYMALKRNGLDTEDDDAVK